MEDATAESGGAAGASPAFEAAPVVADSVSPAPPPDPAEVAGKRSAWEPEPSQLSDSVSDGARVRRRAPYWHRDDAPADTRVDGFAGWDDLPRGFMNAVFELLHEQTNAHRLVRAPNRRARSARALLGDELVAWVRFFFGPALRLTHHSIFFFCARSRIAHDVRPGVQVVAQGRGGDASA